ncbi:MAG: PQQ-binding-like beta-propeller repeat protein [Planctomycetota bacterium]
MTKPGFFSLIFVFVVSLMFLSRFANAQSDPTDWARWRGPTGNGIAAKSETPPTRWSGTENVIWKSKVPGKGHASPIIVDDRIFLATSDTLQQTQSVLCYDRQTGEQKWNTEINRGGLPARIHQKNTHASPTIATDRKHVFAVFLNNNEVSVTALNLDGEKVWQKKVGDYNAHFPFGFGASPIVYNGMVIVTNEGRVDAAVIAYDAATGEQKYRIDRGPISSYSTPVVANVGGKEQLFLAGGRTVKSYDPNSGKENWSAPATWDVCCGTMVWDTTSGKDIVFISGGFPSRETIALDASDGQILWTKPVKSYEQSLLAVDGYVYAHTDRGQLMCWNAKDGAEMWVTKFSNRKRLPVSVSPTLAGGNIYFTAENGETVVAELNPKAFNEVARNQLGKSAFASPAFCGNRIYTRVGEGSQEWLYCLGKE